MTRMLSRALERARKDDRGDIPIAFVYLFPISFMLLMATLFFSFWITQHSVVAEAARAGARAVAQSGYTSSATGPATEVLLGGHAFPNSIQIGAAIINSPNPTCAESAGGTFVSEYAQVRVQASMDNFLRFIFDPAFLNQANPVEYLPISATVRVPVETERLTCS